MHISLPVVSNFRNWAHIWDISDIQFGTFLTINIVHGVCGLQECTRLFLWLITCRMGSYFGTLVIFVLGHLLPSSWSMEPVVCKYALVNFCG